MVYMPQKKWKSLSLPEDVWDRVKEVVDSGIVDYKNPTDFILDAIRRRMEELERIQLAGEEYGLDEKEVKHMAELEHVNVVVNGSGKTIIAVKDHTDNHIYDVVLSQAGKRIKMFCMGDQSFDCVHVKYVWYVIVPKLKQYIELYKKKNAQKEE